nr:voltage-dependent anion-selective channel protein 2-like isoform X4 [Nerophis lumbriciformis]
MAVPPAYTDLGKSAKDIFSKGYGYGILKMDIKTKSQNGVEFATSGSSNTDTGKSGGHLETKYKIGELGLTLSQKWNTDNTLVTEINMEDQLAKGLKLGLDTSFVPNTGKKSAKLKTAYKRDFVNMSCDLLFDKAGPTVHGTAVLGYEGWLAGYQVAFDTAKSKLTMNNFALGYKAPDFQLHTNAKVNNACLVGVGYTQTLRPGIKLTLSALIDGKNVNGGGHKMGLGFELDA